MLDAIKYVVRSSKDVKINMRILNAYVSQLKYSDIQKLLCKKIRLKDKAFEDKVNLLFVYSCINFAFWDPTKRLIDNKKDRKETDNLLKTIEKFLHENQKKALGDLLQTLSFNKFSKMFKNSFSLLLKERWENIREAGFVLKHKYNHSYLNLLKKAHFDTMKALELTTKDFSSFNDRVIYKGKRVQFHKRAQVLLGFISHISHPRFSLKKVDRLLGGADYKIPQLLRDLKIFEYSSSLSGTIDTGKSIIDKSEKEIEIRANTLWVISLFKKKLNKKFKKEINSMEIDSYLWKLSDTMSHMRPHHRTISIYY